MWFDIIIPTVALVATILFCKSVWEATTLNKQEKFIVSIFSFMLLLSSSMWLFGTLTFYLNTEGLKLW